MIGTPAIAGRAATALAPSHELADHVSEVRLRVRAGSLGELLAEAGRALGELQLRGADVTPYGPWRHLSVSASDRSVLLADWLNELIFLAEAERWVGLDFEVESAEDGRVEARVWGVRLERAPGLVKAATLHGVRVDEVAGGVEGEVILDV
jgi:SHS2 domain-containing protein